jgi:hypothetical protein
MIRQQPTDRGRRKNTWACVIADALLEMMRVGHHCGYVGVVDVLGPPGSFALVWIVEAGTAGGTKQKCDGGEPPETSCRVERHVFFSLLLVSAE